MLRLLKLLLLKLLLLKLLLLRLVVRLLLLLLLRLLVALSVRLRVLRLNDRELHVRGHAAALGKNAVVALLELLHRGRELPFDKEKKLQFQRVEFL